MNKDERLCVKCGEPKPLNEFKDYAPRGWCRSCRAERKRNSRAPKEQQAAYMRDYRERKSYEEELSMWRGAFAKGSGLI